MRTKGTIEWINLLPEEIERARRKAQLRPILIGLLLFYMAVLGSSYLYQRSQIDRALGHLTGLKKEKDTLIAKNASYKEVIDRINLTKQRENEIKKRLDVIGSLLEERIYWSRVLKGITYLVPEGLWLTSLSTYDLSKGVGKGIKFTGMALSNLEIAQFIFAMENSPIFGKVSLVYSQKKEFNGKDYYEFEISTELKRREEL